MVVKLSLDGTTVIDNTLEHAGLRDNERYYMREVSSTTPEFVTEAVFSNRLTQEATAQSGILLTFFVTILLGVGERHHLLRATPNLKLNFLEYFNTNVQTCVARYAQ